MEINCCAKMGWSGEKRLEKDTTLDFFFTGRGRKDPGGQKGLFL